LKEALEKECQENDEAIEVVENKLLTDKKKYMAVIDELKLELEKYSSSSSSSSSSSVRLKSDPSFSTEQKSTTHLWMPRSQATRWSLKR
jgi:hypothetical protein